MLSVLRRFLRPSSNPGSMTANTVMIFATKLVGFGFTILLPLLLARRLSQHDFGVYKQAFLLVGTSLTLLAWSLAMSVFYFLPREESRRNSVVANILAMQCAAGLVIELGLWLFPDSIRLVSPDGSLIPHASWIGVVMALWMLGPTLDSILLANQETRLFSLFTVALQFSRAVLLWLAGYIWATPRALLVAAALHGVVLAACAGYYLQLRFPGFWRAVDGALLRRQMAYALPMAISGVLFNLQMDLHNYYVSYHFGAATFAIYAAGVFQVPIIAMLSESMTAVLLPRVSELAQAGSREEIIELTMRAFRKLQIAAFGLYAYLFVVREEFLLLIYTEQYRASIPVFTVNLAMLLLVAQQLIDPVLRAYPQYRFWLILTRLTLAGIQMALLNWLVHKLGLPGAALVLVLVVALDYLIHASLCAYVLGAGWRHLRWLRDPMTAAVAAIAAGGLTALARQGMVGSPRLLVLAVCGLVFVASYGALLALTRVLRAEDLPNLARVPRPAFLRH